MPTVNVFSHHDSLEIEIESFKQFLTNQLSCKDINLSSEEISIRFIKVMGSMIGDVEVEIKVHSFRERIDRQDEIACEIRKYLIKKYPQIGDVRVWLILSELGHSW